MTSERFYQPGTGRWFENRAAAEAAAVHASREATAEEREKQRRFADSLDWRCEDREVQRLLVERRAIMDKLDHVHVELGASKSLVATLSNRIGFAYDLIRREL